MNFVIAVIKPQKLDTVREALSRLGVSGMTATEVRGYGRQKGHKEVYRGSEYNVDFLPKTKIEIAVAAEQTMNVVNAIREAANTGAIGDGKIFVLDLQEAVRVRTGETGDTAL